LYLPVLHSFPTRRSSDLVEEHLGPGPWSPRLAGDPKVDAPGGARVVQHEPQPQGSVPRHRQLTDLRVLKEGGGVVFVRAPQRPGAFLLPGEVPPARPLLHPVERNTREIWVAGAEAPAPPDEKGTTVEGQAGKSAFADHDTDMDEPPASMA